MLNTTFNSGFTTRSYLRHAICWVVPGLVLIIRVELPDIRHELAIRPVEPLKELPRHEEEGFRDEVGIGHDLDVLLGDAEAVNRRSPRESALAKTAVHTWPGGHGKLTGKCSRSCF